MARKNGPLRLKSARWALVATILVVVTGVPASVFACGFCTTPGGLKIAHPKSLDVAIAIRQALDVGLLKSNPSIPSNPADCQFQDLQTARIVAQRMGSRETIELLLIEDGSHYRIESAAELVDQQRLTVPSVRWVTGRAVMRGLLKGDLTLKVALDRGLLLTENRSP